MFMFPSGTILYICVETLSIVNPSLYAAARFWDHTATGISGRFCSAHFCFVLQWECFGLHRHLLLWRSKLDVEKSRERLRALKEFP
jgi:hypothetical protein